MPQSCNATTWPVRLRHALGGTNLGAAVALRRQMLSHDYTTYAEPLIKAFPAEFGGGRCTLDKVMWAADMYYSRAYPDNLCPRPSAKGAAAVSAHPAKAAMLPLWDLLNHDPSLQPGLKWEGGKTGVTASTQNPHGIRAGQEIFTNYGTWLVGGCVCNVRCSKALPRLHPKAGGGTKCALTHEHAVVARRPEKQ